MKNVVVHIETEKKTYPLVFNLNVMEEIQEKYGSLDAWGKMTENVDGASIKDLKFGIMSMINEGIDIENEENGKTEPMITEKQAGRIMTEIGIKEIFDKVHEITVASTESDDKSGKNE